MPGLDPGVDLRTCFRSSRMDCRVEPDNDERARCRERRLRPLAPAVSFEEGHAFLMPGLDPGIQLKTCLRNSRMDCRVEPGNDEGMSCRQRRLAQSLHDRCRPPGSTLRVARTAPFHQCGSIVPAERNAREPESMNTERRNRARAVL